MKKSHILLLTAVLLAGAVKMESCKAVKENADNITSASDFASAETEFGGAFDITDDINQSDGKIKKGSSTVLPGGAVFTWIDSSYTDGDGIEYTLDFGDLGSSAPHGLLCGDGKYRAGKLRVTVSQPYLQIGTEVVVTASESLNGNKYFSGDGVNMFEIEGVLSVTRTAAEEVTVNVTGGKISDGNGKNASFHGIRYIKRTAGGGTPGIWGDIYEVTGNGGGTNSDGDDYTWTITEALVKKMQIGCAKTFVKGVIEVKNVNSSSSLIVDFDPYNNEACDKTAKAIIGKKEIIFTVK